MLGGEHMIQYTGDVLWSLHLKFILSTNVTQMNLI